ncbi:hypothetical protein KJ762_11480 [bacterium]|nr:hypothetical protein [bacterium]MBU1065812.1 hypothetical protein [bacterium]MBU1635111.1 hypothetical protein [bacterium]MBU1875077.1 hypothetical protein [bacterium]
MIADRYGAVIMSNDGGVNWYQGTQPDTSSSFWANGVVTVPGTDVIFALSDNGVFYTSDLGATWKKWQLRQLPMMIITHLPFF